MKKIVVLIALVLCGSLAVAQDAKTLLDEVSQKVRSYDNIVISFKNTLNNSSQGVNQETRGDVTIKGDMYVLNMLGTTRMFNGKQVFNIVPEDEEVTISNYNAKEDKEITPSKMLTFYENGYRYSKDIVQTVKGRKIQYIKLEPIDSNAEIKDILLGIDVQTKHIYKLIQTDAKGTKYTITVNSFKTNQPISGTLFSFDEAKYAKDGYYINRIN
ncbi:MAG: outer membrane lipoprotein carrier protein LolA [Gilvibacter sp.]